MFYPDDTYRQYERGYSRAVYSWFNRTYPGKKMNDIRYKLFKDATGGELGNYPEETRNKLQECINRSKEA